MYQFPWESSHLVLWKDLKTNICPQWPWKHIFSISLFLIFEVSLPQLIDEEQSVSIKKT